MSPSLCSTVLVALLSVSIPLQAAASDRGLQSADRVRRERGTRRDGAEGRRTRRPRNSDAEPAPAPVPGPKPGPAPGPDSDADAIKCLLPGLDYPYLYDIPRAAKPATSVSECAAVCEMTPGCNMAAYVSTVKRCYPKKVPQSQPDTTAIEAATLVLPTSSNLSCIVRGGLDVCTSKDGETVCAECRDDEDCERRSSIIGFEERAFCLPDEGGDLFCAECRNDDECNLTSVCTFGVCAACSDASCAAKGLLCFQPFGCVECVEAKDCEADKPFCVVSGGGLVCSATA